MKTSYKIYNWSRSVRYGILIEILVTYLMSTCNVEFVYIIISNILILLIFLNTFSTVTCNDKLIQITYPYRLINKNHIHKLYNIKQVIFRVIGGRDPSYILQIFEQNKQYNYQLEICYNSGYYYKLIKFMQTYHVKIIVDGTDNNSIDDLRPHDIKISHYIFIIFLSSITITFFGYFLFIRKTNDIELTKILIILLLTALVCSLISVIHYYIRHKQIIKFNKHFDK